MSDTPKLKFAGNRTVKESGEFRLKNRAPRLMRLVELGAPPIILVREAMLVMDALWLAYPAEMGEMEAERKNTQLKILAGYCGEPKCNNAALVDDTICPSCRDAMDAEEEEDETEPTH